MKEIWEPIDDMAYSVEYKITMQDLIKATGLPKELIAKKLTKLIEQINMKKKPNSPKLKRYYLKPIRSKINKKHVGWELKDSDGKIWVVETVKSKAIQYSSEFIRSHGGGTLLIMLRNGKFQEERTYPKGRDPRRSKG